MRIYVEWGAPMERLLYRAIENETLSAVAGRLLSAFPKTNESTPALRLAQDRLAEPLSERELDVLRAIASGMTNQEVGLALSISLATVKWHTRNIYGKLLVQNRTQAVARARGLGLLDEQG